MTCPPMSGIINEIWVKQIDSGLYCTPTNAPANMKELPMDQQVAILNHEPGKAMFREFGTPSARLNGVTYIHTQSALPGMFNELEQDAITNKRMIMHNVHAALTVFGAYGFTYANYIRALKTRTRLQTIASFHSFVLVGTSSVPSTQEYEFDWWAGPQPNNMDGQWWVRSGENWQHAYSTRATWNPMQGSGSPMNKNDCESKGDGIVAEKLTIDQCNQPTVQDTRKYVWTHVMQMKGGVPEIRDSAALSSLDAFISYQDEVYNAPNAPMKGSAESMLNATTTVVMWMAKYGAVHHTLGLAYAANPMQKMTPEALAARHPGGKLFPTNHEYTQTVCDPLTLIPSHLVSRPLVRPVHREGPYIREGNQGKCCPGGGDRCDPEPHEFRDPSAHQVGWHAGTGAGEHAGVDTQDGGDGYGGRCTGCGCPRR